ncbi:MAG TPA: HoxN/HupN/NixA family nickel/cobalt transporter [bacterium]|jgi:high-affinity nickel-transport protein|nr:HoxN/HupN/NixA family nickel/cobalt transporter [bacterium]
MSFGHSHGIMKSFRSLDGLKARLLAVYVPILAMAGMAWAVVFAYDRRVNAAATAASGASAGVPVLVQTVHHYPAALALAFVCFLMGFRHAMDVDHIAAIDNVTRKLANDGQRAVGVGFFFSFGHSVAVLVMATALVVAELWLKKDLMQYSDMIDMVGSSVCALVLYLLAVMNIPVLLNVLRSYKKLDSGAMTRQEFDQEIQQKGFMNRYFRWIYRSVHSSWQMFPVGFLFGLGFDTATEMVVLAATATAAATSALPLPIAFFCLLLFFSSMMFLDSTDSVTMLYAYRWAFSDPKRKTLYNLSMTSISMLIAFGIGTVEWLQVVSVALGLKGGVWYWLNQLDLTTLGVASALLFVVLWAVAMLVYKKVNHPSDGPGQEDFRPGMEQA